MDSPGRSGSGGRVAVVRCPVCGEGSWAGDTLDGHITIYHPGTREAGAAARRLLRRPQTTPVPPSPPAKQVPLSPPPPPPPPPGRVHRQLSAALRRAEAGGGCDGATLNALHSALLSEVSAAHAVPTPQRYEGEGSDGLLVRRLLALRDFGPGGADVVARAGDAVADGLKLSLLQAGQREVQHELDSVSDRRMAMAAAPAVDPKRIAAELAERTQEEEERRVRAELQQRRQRERERIESRIASTEPQIRALLDIARGVGGTSDIAAVAAQHAAAATAPPPGLLAVEAHLRRERMSGPGGVPAPSPHQLRERGYL